MAGKLLLFRRHLPYNPPMFTDTHCHLADPALLPQLPEVLAAARAANVCRFIVPATCRADWAAVLLGQPQLLFKQADLPRARCV